jgi:hypothetical protein
VTWRLGFRDFFEDFRGRECLVTYSVRDPGDWWIAPLNKDGSEGEAFCDLTGKEEEVLNEHIGQVQYDRANE